MTEPTTVQHTPGPWRVTEDGDRVIVDAGKTGSGIKGVAICGSRRSVVGQANARLIAAAPDLLAACECAVEHGCKWPGLLAAIAKAKGR